MAVSGGATTTTTYVGSLEEIATTGSTTTTTAYYGGLALSVNGTLSYTLSDGLGSVSEAVALDGSVTATQLYGPYGAVRYSNGTLPGTRAYTGQRADAATGLDYDNARYYDPIAGQFTSADTVLTTKKGAIPTASQLNRYAYVGGNPETLTDPSGHVPYPPYNKNNGGDPNGAAGRIYQQLQTALAIAFRNANGGSTGVYVIALGHGQSLAIVYNGSQLMLDLQIPTSHGLANYTLDVTNTPMEGMWAAILLQYMTTPHALHQGVKPIGAAAMNPADPMAGVAQSLQTGTGGTLALAANGNGWLVTVPDSANTMMQFRLMNGTSTPARNAGQGAYLRVQIGSLPGQAPVGNGDYLDLSGGVHGVNGKGNMISDDKAVTHIYLGAQAGNPLLITALCYSMATNYEATQGRSFP